MSVASQVVNRVNRMAKGKPFTIAGFYSLGSTASVQKALSRLAKEGVVERVSKGIYVRPKPLTSMPSIKTTASARQVAATWAREHGYTLVRQGQEEAYRLGLQTQAPMKEVYWSNGPNRTFSVGRETVEVHHVATNKLKWQNQIAGTLLRGLIVTPVESVSTTVLFSAFKRLSLSKQESMTIVKKLSSEAALKRWQPIFKEVESVH